MALDYNQKKQVSRNRPRKRPVKFLLLLILGSIVSIYGLGIATGWLVFKYLPQNTPTSSADSAKPAGTDQVIPSPAPATSKGATAASDREPDLTFYYTLPKGEKGVMGSGINTLHPQPAPKKTLQAAAPVLKVQSPLEQEQKKETAPPAVQREKGSTAAGTDKPAPAKKDADNATYTVQIAACHDKNDAQELKTNLQKTGISARIEEFSVAGKGIWYRVRTGSRLDRDTANKLAAKIGNNAMLVAE
jgi:cell division septation protein DedD